MTHTEAVAKIIEILEYAIEKHYQYGEADTAKTLEVLYDFALELEIMAQETKQQQYEKNKQASRN